MMSPPSLNILPLGLLLLAPIISGCGASMASQRPGEDERTQAEKAQYHYDLATGLIHEGKPISALRELDEALRLDPTHAKSYYLMGFVYMGRRNYGEARIHLQKAVDLDPKLYEARNALAATYLALKRWQDAIDTVQPLIEDPLNPTPWLAYNNAGWAHHKLGHTSKALQHLEQALFFNPKFCLGYYNMGLVLKDAGRLEQARMKLEQANKRCPKHAPTLLHLGEIYEHAARWGEARTAYQSCHEIAEGSLLGERCRTREAGVR